VIDVVMVVRGWEKDLVFLWVFGCSVEVAFAVVEGSRDWKPVDEKGRRDWPRDFHMFTWRA
jgi:hypothetical protein